MNEFPDNLERFELIICFLDALKGKWVNYPVGYQHFVSQKTNHVIRSFRDGYNTDMYRSCL